MPSRRAKRVPDWLWVLAPKPRAKRKRRKAIPTMRISGPMRFARFHAASGVYYRPVPTGCGYSAYLPDGTVIAETEEFCERYREAVASWRTVRRDSRLVDSAAQRKAELELARLDRLGPPSWSEAAAKRYRQWASQYLPPS